jgi:PAS domain S-box-containing protein
MPGADPTRLRDKARLAHLWESGLFGSPPEEAFDRHTRIAAGLVGAPVALLSIVSADAQYRKSVYDDVGLNHPRTNPLSHSFCQHVVATGEALRVDDSHAHPLVSDNGYADDVRAYLGVPVRLGSGHVLGALCAIAPQPRPWPDQALNALTDVAALVVTEIELRLEVRRRAEAIMLQNQRLRLERVIVELSSSLLQASPYAMEQSIGDALDRIAAGLNDARVTLFRADQDVPGRWTECSGTGETRLDLHDPWLAATVAAGKPLLIRDTARPEGKAGTVLAALESAGVRGVALLPVPPASAVELVLAIESAEPLSWPEDFMVVLQFAAGAMHSALLLAQSMGELAEVKTRFANILATAPDAVVSMNRAGVIVDFNPAAEAMFGRPASEVVGRQMAELLVPPEYREAHHMGVARYLAAGTGPILNRRIETAASRAGGEQFPVELSVAPIRMPSGEELFTAHIRDITQSRARLASISHELRTPINAIVGLAHLLGRTQLDHEQTEYSAGIRYSAHLLLSLISDFIDLSRGNAGQLRFDRVPFNIKDTVHHAAAYYAEEAAAKGLGLAVELDPDLPRMVVGDPVRLNQVLVNLIGNALKFTERGSVDVAVAVMAVEDQAMRVQFAVADTGIGIIPDRIHSIFRPFEQASPETAARYGGTGLGLAIVKQLVEAQGGTVSVRSTPGAGSTFTVEVLYSHCHDAMGIADDPAEVDLTGRRILVVDDAELNRLVMMRTFQAAGAEVETAGNGQEAMEIMGRSEFDLLVLDLQMPVMDGYETAWRVRHELGIPAERMPVLAVTASALIEDYRRVEAVGVNELVLKPCEPTVLLERAAAQLAASTGRTHDGTAPGQREAELPGAPEGMRPLRLRPVDAAVLSPDVLEIFRRTVMPMSAELEQAVAAGDVDGVARLAHRLKGTAGYLGATRLYDSAAQVERNARGPGVLPDAEDLQELKELMEQASDAIKHHLSLEENAQ